MSPKVLCHESYFTLAPDLRRSIQCFRLFGDLPVRPVFQHLLAEPTHFLDHPPLRLVGFAQIVPRILNQVDQSLNPVAQLRTLLQSRQQALVLGGSWRARQCSAHMRPQYS